MAELIFGVIGVATGITGAIIAIVTSSRNKHNTTVSEGREDGIILTEIGYVKAGIDDLKQDRRSMQSELQAVHDMGVKTAESCKQAHKRLDKLEQYHQPN